MTISMPKAAPQSTSAKGSDPYIGCTVPGSVKKAFRLLAVELDVTVSDLLREVIADAIQSRGTR